MDIKNVFGEVKPPAEFMEYGEGSAGLSTFLSVLVDVLYTIGAIVVVFMVLWGALDWISSGGEKEKIEGARNKITHALIGLIILGVVFAILSVLQQFTGMNFIVVPEGT